MLRKLMAAVLLIFVLAGCADNGTAEIYQKDEYDEKSTAYTNRYDGDGNLIQTTVHQYYENGDVSRYEVYNSGDDKFLVIEYNEASEKTGSKWYKYDRSEQ